VGKMGEEAGGVVCWWMWGEEGEEGDLGDLSPKSDGDVTCLFLFLSFSIISLSLSPAHCCCLYKSSTERENVGKSFFKSVTDFDGSIALLLIFVPPMFL